MKRIYLLLVLFTCGKMLNAQGNYPKPEYANYPYFFDKGNQKLVALEKSSAKIKNKTKIMGYGGSTQEYVIEGNKATVIIKSADTCEFIMTGMNSMMDPSAMITLYSFKPGGKERVAIMQQQGGRFGKDKDNPDKISFNVKKEDDKIIFVLPKLAPGEYGFVNMMSMSGGRSMDAFCFHVD
jgi:hypothetical protein